MERRKPIGTAAAPEGRKLGCVGEGAGESAARVEERADGYAENGQGNAESILPRLV